MSEEIKVKTRYAYKGVKPYRNLCLVRVATKINPLIAQTVANHPQKLTDDDRRKILKEIVVICTGPDAKETTIGDIVLVNGEFFNRPSIEYYRVDALNSNGLIDYIHKLKDVTRDAALAIANQDGLLDENNNVSTLDYYIIPEYEIYSGLGVTTAADLDNIFEGITTY